VFLHSKGLASFKAEDVTTWAWDDVVELQRASSPSKRRKLWGANDIDTEESEISLMQAEESEILLMQAGDVGDLLNEFGVTEGAEVGMEDTLKGVDDIPLSQLAAPPVVCTSSQQQQLEEEEEEDEPVLQFLPKDAPIETSLQFLDLDDDQPSTPNQEDGDDPVELLSGVSNASMRDLYNPANGNPVDVLTSSLPSIHNQSLSLFEVVDKNMEVRRMEVRHLIHTTASYRSYIARRSCSRPRRW
jgi:hypothetical protein